MKTEEEAAAGSTTELFVPKKSSARKSAKPTAKKTSKSTTPKRQRAKAKTKASKKDPRSKEEGRSGTKKSIVLELLRRKDGATLAEIAKATSWQNHSIRGFISGTLVKKMRLPVESSKSEAGERTYRVAE